MRCIVIGGGVVGLCCAYALQRAGAEVIVVERGVCGGAASRGNAGWIVPSYSTPLSEPGTLKQSLGWIFRNDGPLRIYPRFSADFLRWCWRFWKSSTQQNFEQGLKALLTLNRHTIRLFDELRAAGVEFEMHSTGLLVVTLTQQALEKEVEEYHKINSAGYAEDAEVLDSLAIRRLEPALSDEVVGGLHLKAERYVRPESLTRGLVDYLRSVGVQILEDTEVHNMEPAGPNGWRLNTSRRCLEGDCIVVAAGVWSSQLLSSLGVRIPLEGAKGCSITASGHGTRPRYALKLAEARVTCSPFVSRTRITGTLDLTGMDPSLDRRRMETMVSASEPYLRDWRPEKPELEWAGLRPLTPDSLPLIGSVPGLHHLYLATGHGQLGVTLAPATGAVIAPLILEGHVVPEVEPFAVDRF